MPSIQQAHSESQIVLGDIIDAGDEIIAQVRYLVCPKLTFLTCSCQKATTHMTLPDDPDIVLLNLCIFSFEGGEIVHVKQSLDSLFMAKLVEKFNPEA